MTTIDAWIAMLALTAMLIMAAHTRVASRLHRIAWVDATGRWTTRFIDRWYWVLFAAILLIGVAVRLWRMPELPRALYHDGAMAALEAQSLLRFGTDHYGTSWPVYFEAWRFGQMSVLLSYLMIPFFWLFGVSILTIRMPILLMSLAALPILWDLCRRTMGKRFALLALGMLAICPWQIVQSRWALDCNTMGHMFLFSVYFLCLGLRRRPFLYVSMVFFGLTMYAYGVALYTLPVFLGLACAYLLRHRRIRWWEALISMGVFVLVSGPFIWTMILNFLKLDTMHLGPFTMQLFAESGRANDILLFSETPIAQFLWNLQSLITSTIGQNEGDTIAAYFATRTLYPFSVPVIIAGIYMAWRARRARAVRGVGQGEQPAQDGMTLMLCWLVAMVVCGLLTNFTTAQRSNAIFYPLIFLMCYALYQTVRRVPAFIPVILLIYTMGFGVFCAGYFGDQAYIERTAVLHNDDYYGATRDVRPMDCDRYYLYASGNVPTYEVMILLNHQVSPAQWYDETPMYDMQDNEMDYYSGRYIYTDFAGFEPDPGECAAYVILREQKALFAPEDFIIQDYGMYATVYPRYWAED